MARSTKLAVVQGKQCLVFCRIKPGNKEYRVIEGIKVGNAQLGTSMELVSVAG